MGLSEMLIAHARMNLQIQAEFARKGGGLGSRYYTYVLMLQGQRFYVGSTDNIYQRFYHHFGRTAWSAQWVRAHGPVVRVVEVTRNSKKEDEVYKTLQYMSMFGWENVRGASYCRTGMSRPPPDLDHFVPSRSDFEHLTRSEISEIAEVVKVLSEEFPFPAPTAQMEPDRPID